LLLLQKSAASLAAEWKVWKHTAGQLIRQVDLIEKTRNVLNQKVRELLHQFNLMRLDPEVMALIIENNSEDEEDAGFNDTDNEEC
jgi:hypothetical protein